MGYRATSYAVFGHKTTRSALTVTKKIRGCHHDIEGSHQFCSKCGKPAWRDVQNLAVEETLDSSGQVSFFPPSHDSEEGILGVYLGSTSNSDISSIRVPSQKDVEKIKAFYEQHDMDSSLKELDMYVMTHHSY